ncbi:hypothetical protein [Halomonas koreensis]|uniref:Uncharacterized protein n=1 Tax=Halomonas koreensis TaxID=245385 RepID=A0ABU1G2S3_9GAMM|nr:hypothetical protein [Halomonas koreensis]MDR5867250.1 hypothetical protein [Halomonas koreensis]
MTQPTHTHRQHGGRYGQVTTYWGSGPLEGQQLVVYQDLDRVTESLTTMEDWEKNWRPLAADDCSLCLGTGRDAIKGNKANPCGGCYGLGKVRQNGERPEDCWQVAEVAGGIIQRQQQELGRLRQIAAMPEVKEIVENRRAQKDRAWIDEEQEWRAGPGRGHGGRRHTGD